MAAANALPNAYSSEPVFSLPALKKYGEVRPDFKVNEPKSRAWDESARERSEAAYGLSSRCDETLVTGNGVAMLGDGGI